MDAKRVVGGAALAGAVVAAGLGSGGAATASAAAATSTTVVYAGDDTYTSSARTGANFGSADKLVVGRSEGETRVSYVKFGIGALPAGAGLTTALLKLPL